jgi:integrase/recombinase XerD
VPFVQSQYQDFRNYLNYCRPGLVKDNAAQEAFLLNSHGRRITYLNALTILKTLQQRTGNEAPQNKQVGLHTLRHSIATHLLQRKMPLEDISQFLGHKSIYSTEVYTHMFTSMETFDDFSYRRHYRPRTVELFRLYAKRLNEWLDQENIDI